MPRLQKKLPLRRLPTKKLSGRAPCRFRRDALQIRSAFRTWELGPLLSLSKSLHTATMTTFEEGVCRANSSTYQKKWSSTTPSTMTTTPQERR